MMNWLYANWFGIISFVIATWMAFKLYKLSLRDKTVRHTWEDVVVISAADPDDEHLKIMYGAYQVPKVTRSRLAFWNDGRATINGSDVHNDDPLRIEAAEGERILRVQVVKRTRDIAGGDVPGVSEKKAVLRFDFLDRNDGFVIEVLHTGDPGSLTLKGTIRGIPMGSTPLDRDRHARWIMSGFILLLSPMLLAIPAIVIGVPAFLLWRAWLAPWPMNLVLALAGIASPFVMWFFFRLDSGEANTGPLKITGVPDELAEQMRLGGRSASPLPAPVWAEWISRRTDNRPNLR